MSKKQRTSVPVAILLSLSAAAAAQDQSPLDRLVEGATGYVNAHDPDYAKFKRTLEDRIRQKQTDGGLSESAAEEAYGTDYLSDRRLVLLKGPGPDKDGKQIDAKWVLDFARHVRYMGERKITPTNWEIFLKQVVVWGEWFAKETSGKS